MSSLEAGAKAKGKFRVQKVNSETGELYFDSGEFNNNLLNNFFSESVSLSVCYACTDSAVNNTDTTASVIGSQAASRSISSSYSVDGAGNVTVLYINQYTFNPGAVVGNMSCIAISDNASLTGTNLKVKALVKDVNGDPTTIPVVATDQLIVTHTLAVTFAQHQLVGTINIDGVDYQVDFYCTSWAISSQASPGSIFGQYPVGESQAVISNIFPRISTSFVPPSVVATSPATLALGGYLGSQFAGSHAYDPTAGIMKVRYSFTVPATFNLNTADPIKAVGCGTASSGTACQWIVAFTPALPKNSSIAYTFTFDLVLSRA